jgi:hypothetical protein
MNLLVINPNGSAFGLSGEPAVLRRVLKSPGVPGIAVPMAGHVVYPQPSLDALRAALSQLSAYRGYDGPALLEIDGTDGFTQVAFINNQGRKIRPYAISLWDKLGLYDQPPQARGRGRDRVQPSLRRDAEQRYEAPLPPPEASAPAAPSYRANHLFAALLGGVVLGSAVTAAVAPGVLEASRRPTGR